MKAAKLYGSCDIRIEDIPEPILGAGELLLGVTAVGICGSDLHTYLHGQIGGSIPSGAIILGHEAAGIVEKIGAGVHGFSVGQQVAIDPAIPCFHCEYCLAGHPNLCTELRFMGLWPHHGALRERMSHPAHACIPLPDSISDEAAALLEPLGVALHAIRLAKIALGDDVLITGCGAIGLMLIRLARLAGARRIYASDKYDWRLQRAQDYGADTIIDVSLLDTNVARTVLDKTNGRGVDVAIESAWADETVNHCIDSTRNGGRVVVVGIPVEEEIRLKASPTRRKGLTIKFSRRMKNVYTSAISLVEEGKIDLESLISHRFPLSQAAKALETAARYTDKVVRAVVMPQRF